MSKAQLGSELWVWPVSCRSGAESWWGDWLLWQSSALWLLLFLSGAEGESRHGDGAVQAQQSAAPPIARLWGRAASWGM